jgi:hypothetical protein
MLCVAKVNLSDWPEGHRRDVDPQNERIIGLLKGGYIAPLQLPRRPAPETPPAASSTPIEAPAPDTAAKPARRPRAAPAPKPAASRAKAQRDE